MLVERSGGCWTRPPRSYAKARAFGDAAVVTGRGLPTAEGRPEVRFTLVYAKRQGGWQMVAGHISLVPARE